MFQSRKDLTERIAILEQELTEAEGVSNDASTALAETQAGLASMTQDLDAAKSDLAQAQAELETVRKDLSEVGEELSQAQTKLETFDAEVDAAAKATSSAHLESIGHPSLPIESDDATEQTTTDHAAELDAIEDPAEAYVYANTHRAAIMQELYAAKP